RNPRGTRACGRARASSPTKRTGRASPLPCGSSPAARSTRSPWPDSTACGVESPGMAVRALHAIQNGFMGAQRSLLFYGEYTEAVTQIPITCWLVRTDDASILFDTGVSPRAVAGLMRNDPYARFTDADLLVHRLDALGLEP